MKIVCVTTTPTNPWLGKLIGYKGDIMIVMGEDGIEREVPWHECEVVDEEDEKNISFPLTST